jgi:hypothetical protein
MLLFTGDPSSNGWGCIVLRRGELKRVAKKPYAFEKGVGLHLLRTPDPGRENCPQKMKPDPIY